MLKSLSKNIFNMKNWIINPNYPATDGQKKLISILIEKVPNLKMLKNGEIKSIDELTMGEADKVIKKLSKIKIKPNGENNNK